MRRRIPAHVLFNGRVGMLTGDSARTAKVDEGILIVHDQARRDTPPCRIGGDGDLVWEQGKFVSHPPVDLETWFIRGGRSGAALDRFRRPGVSACVDPNLIEAPRRTSHRPNRPGLPPARPGSRRRQGRTGVGRWTPSGRAARRSDSRMTP